jgi:YaiO family outer membrane protein
MRESLRLLAQAVSLASAVAAAPAAFAQPADPSAVPVAESYEQQFVHARDLATSGRREEAIALYSAMLERSPGNSDILLGRGRTYAWMDRWPEAEADLLAVTAKSPDYADAWSALGDMYLWSDRPQQAADAYSHWVSLDTSDPAAVIARGRAYRAAGNREAARADFEAARARGAEVTQVEEYVASLQPRIENQEAAVPPGYRWLLRVNGTHTEFSPDRSNWNEYEVSLRRKFDRGSLALEMLRGHRFDTHDTAWALDGYVTLWDRAYANLRYQRGPSGDLFPEHAWRGELFQGVGQGWELSGSYDHLQFDGSDTDMYGVGVGRYVGNFYARYRALYVSGSGNLSHRGQLRYYYAGNADDYFEVSAGYGRSHEAETGGFDRVVGSDHSSVGVTYVKFFRPKWGLKLGADYANDVDGFDERSITAALYTRW